jgi:uncharacterized protein (DUF1015 family)
MVTIKPFKALRPKNELAEKVASLPYDVMNSAEAKEMAKGNEFSFLHVSKSEIDLPDGTDIHDAIVYQRAKLNFDSFIEKGYLIQDEREHYYIYAQTMDGRTQTGIVACSSIDDYFENIIKKHEYTRPEKEQDRIEHMKALQAHVGPIFLTFKSNDEINQIIAKIKSSEILYSFTTDDTIKHEVWIIKENEDIHKLTTAFKQDIECTYIADGHHRTASAAKVGMGLREENKDRNAEFNFFLSVLFPSDQLVIMDYNRLVKDLNGMSKDELLDKISVNFNIQESNFYQAKPTVLHEFGMYCEDNWYKLTAKSSVIKSDPIGILDVSILQDNILSPILDIKDPRTDNRIDFVGGIRGLNGLQKRVDSGEMKIAFALYPVSIEQLMNIADSSNVMPPKSTWFEPKLRDGLFCHLF